MDGVCTVEVTYVDEVTVNIDSTSVNVAVETPGGNTIDPDQPSLVVRTTKKVGDNYTGRGSKATLPYSVNGEAKSAVVEQTFSGDTAHIDFTLTDFGTITSDVINIVITDNITIE